MTRPDGFPTADIDVALLDDAKVRRLARLLPKSGPMAEAVVLYLATVLHSWAAGDRVPADDAAPLWLRCGTAVASLEQVGLLDADGRIPATVWDGWYGPARDRRTKRRESGRKGGLRKAAASTATASPKRRHGVAVPVRPSVLPNGRDGRDVRDPAPAGPSGPVPPAQSLQAQGVPPPPGHPRSAA